VIQAKIGVAEITQRPGALMGLVADRLICNGIGVGLPWLDDEHCLPIACPPARCTLTVHDSGLVIWEWRPAPGGQVDPKQLADLACALLTGQAGDQPRRGDGYGRPTVTLKGVVGRELAARGLTVGLELYEDPVFYDVYAAVVAASPGSGPDAEVRVTDDGCLSWEANYRDETALPAGSPEHVAQVAGQEALVADIVARVTLALLVARPGPARHPAGRGRQVWLWGLQVASGSWRRV